MLSAPCSAGDYMTDSGCQQCGENSYSGDGASSCTSCPEGKVSAAIRMLCDEDNRGVLELSEETKAELMKKHPPPAPIKCDSLLCGPLLQIDEIYFSKLDYEMIARSAKMTRGSAQTDADFFTHILTHRNFNIEGILQ